MKKLFVFGFLAALFSTSAVAQSITGDTCVLLANTIAAGYTVSFSDRQFDALRYYANCSITTSSSAAGLNIAYEAFSLGARYDDATRSEFCSRSYTSYGIKATEYNSAKVLFTQALPTIDKCLDAAGKGWRINYAQISPDSVSLNITHGGALGNRLLGIDIVPRGALNCLPRLPSAAITVSATAPYSTTCSRTPTTDTVDGIEMTTAKDVVLNLRLADAPFPIPMAGYKSSLLQHLDQKIDAGLAQIASKLPTAVDFSIVRKSGVQDAFVDCIETLPPGYVLISAACVGEGYTHTAVGPQFHTNGKVQCRRYSGPASVEAVAVCMKMKN